VARCMRRRVAQAVRTRDLPVTVQRAGVEPAQP